MSRVEINGQVKIGQCSSIYGSTGEAKVDRQTTAFSVNRPRNWGELCDEIDRILVDYTRMMSSFKVYYPFFITAIVFAGVIYVLPSSAFESAGTLLRYMPAVYIPLILGFAYFAFKESSIWDRVKRACLTKGVNGVRYELLFEMSGKWKTRYIMVHLLDEEGQNEQSLNAIPAAPVVQQPVISNQSNNDWASSSPPTTAPADSHWAVSDPPPAAPANGGTVSLFDQLRST